MPLVLERVRELTACILMPLLHMLYPVSGMQEVYYIYSLLLFHLPPSVERRVLNASAPLCNFALQSDTPTHINSHVQLKINQWM